MSKYRRSIYVVLSIGGLLLAAALVTVGIAVATQGMGAFSTNFTPHVSIGGFSFDLYPQVFGYPAIALMCIACAMAPFEPKSESDREDEKQSV